LLRQAQHKSKQKLDCSLLRPGAPDKPLHKVVENTPEGVAKLLEWATGKAECEASQLHSIMEATGPYHEAAALTLFNTGCKVSVVNPAHAKYFAKGLGGKSNPSARLRARNDKLDAQALARFGLMTNPPAWQPPAPEYRRASTTCSLVSRHWMPTCAVNVTAWRKSKLRQPGRVR
jgi:transposase